MNIKVLGTGCSRCKALEHITKKALEELGIDAIVEKVEDIQKIMEYGILRTPGLVVNEKVILSGQTPKLKEMKTILSKIK